jgi:hypothetical protein
MDVDVKARTLKVMRLLVRDDKQSYVGNMTKLAEDAAHEMCHDDWLDDETHEIWELAELVATEEDLLE